MAAPPSIMSALDELSKVLYLNIQPEATHNGLVHYIVSSRQEDTENVKLYKVIADVSNEHITLHNSRDQLVFSCLGGVQNEQNMMSIFTALNYFRGPILTICGAKIQVPAMMEENPSLQIRIIKIRINNSYEIREFKNGIEQRRYICHIHHRQRNSLLLIGFDGESHAQLGPLKKAFCILAGIKIMHNNYKFHLYLMPSELAHLLPAGVPLGPLELLKTVSELMIRPSATISSTRTGCCVLIEGHSLKPLLVLKYETSNNEESDHLYISYTDTYGDLQFRIIFNRTSSVMKVFDSKENIFGTYDGDPRSHKVDNEEVMFLKSVLYPRTRSKTYDFCDVKLRTSLATTLLMEDWQIIQVKMNCKLDVKWKAVVLAHTAVLALLNLKIWIDSVPPTITEYLFRKKLGDM